MRNLLLALFGMLLFHSTFSQIYEYPIAAKQSHEDLKINTIEITTEYTIIHLSITNQLNAGGWFCAGNSILLKNSKGSEIYQLTRSENIPVCPDKYEFKSKGEVLEFILYFPPIHKDIKFLDLIENCDEACFSFEGIILDNEHNKKILKLEQAMELYSTSRFAESVPLFKQVLEGKQTIESQIFGLSYYYLVLSYHKINDKTNTDYWYKALQNSTVPLKEEFIKELNLQLGY
ncbi:MAG: hypothetical protein A2X13_07775 [Bacteroidetes bacterium GWC2_33_15]|nr:MAG: hypothetical protein A2X10_04830 [Bacteroidetes bacterium GWA2_33_15]OFX52650.1 MAG: hypothetical protein A2X13_07775 [Bacteroidetes bacterium GWC2_33_15]OFX64044.1 MAG: hypothetical protein A2X15_02560 [Bacteroidetes bacterium GWB2_32_14]OFX67271.1 MAG: hypothetical protein A2X14_11855 [Bacteroidetes bacterium GWD2_33_33]HAN18870.1 hypothetical protein [Bacteroidales bacterium]